MSEAEGLGYDLNPHKKEPGIKYQVSSKQMEYLSSSEVIRGLGDSYELFDVASKSVIDYFFESLINNGHIAPQFISFYLNKVLGETPLVTTQELREDGEYEFDSKNYSNLALLFLTKSFAVTRAINSAELVNIGWLIRWCLNDPAFKHLVKDTIMSEEMNISLLRDSMRYELQHDRTEDNKKLKATLELSIEQLTSEDKEIRLNEYERLHEIARFVNFESSSSHLNPKFADWIRSELMLAIDGSSKYSSY